MSTISSQYALWVFILSAHFAFSFWTEGGNILCLKVDFPLVVLGLWAHACMRNTPAFTHPYQMLPTVHMWLSFLSNGILNSMSVNIGSESIHSASGWANIASESIHQIHSATNMVARMSGYLAQKPVILGWSKALFVLEQSIADDLQIGFDIWTAVIPALKEG